MEATVTKLDSKSRRFLSGRLKNTSEIRTVSQSIESYIRQRSQSSFPSALRTARRFVAQIENRGLNGHVSMSAYRVLARTLHLKGEYVEAAEMYRRARSAGKNDSQFRASIDRALIDVFMYMNKSPEARRCYRIALATFRRLGSEDDIAMTQVNYANLLHRNDKHRSAERLYREAGIVFEKSGNEFAVARAAFNRANTLLQMFDTGAAQTLYEQAFSIYNKLGLTLDANEARYGLAWLRMLIGEYHIALQDLSECQTVYRDAGQKRGIALCELDKAESYLQLNLFMEALECARLAEKRFSKLRLSYERSKASLFRASAAYGLGRIREARASITRARVGFTATKNSQFLGAVSLVEAQLTRNNNDRMRCLRAARKRFVGAQLPLWEAICDLQIASSKSVKKSELKRLASNKAVQVSPHLYTAWKTLLGDEAYQRGSTDEARRRWTEAADRLDSLRAQLPPVELRRSIVRQRHSPHQKLIADQMRSNPMSAAAWIERYQTAGIWAPVSGALDTERTRASITENLSDLAQRYGALSQSLSGRSGERAFSSNALNSHIERVFRQSFKAHTGHENKQQPSVDHELLIASLREVSKETPILQFHFDETRLAAFLHYDGRVRVHLYGNGAAAMERFLQEWRFILNRELLVEHLPPTVSPDRETKFFERFGRWLWEPLEIPTDYKKLLIIPEGQLAILPWEALVANQRRVESDYQIVVCPSLRHYLRSRNIHSNSDSIQVFEGASKNLPAVRTEIEQLYSCAKERCEIFKNAKRDDWPIRGQADMWHYSGHGHLRSDNPFYSSLELSDAPLFAADFRLRRVEVNLVTLAACRTGEDAAAPGDESTGLVRSLLEMGARNVIGSRWPVSDQSTALWMSEFYRTFLNGGSLADSMATARANVRERYPSAYHWAAFALYGAGDLPTKEST